MRDKKRIGRILKLIRKIWDKHPDFRLFQLLGNPYDAGDHYYVEDENLERALTQFYEVINEKENSKTKKNI